MSSNITDQTPRVQAQAERPVQQVKAVQSKRAEAADTRQQTERAAQEAKTTTSRQADKGRFVDRYA